MSKLFRYFRILILLSLLFGVAMSAWLTKLRSTDWNEPLWISVYPINGDGSEKSERYISRLTAEHFQAIAEFTDEEAQYFKLPLRHPFNINLAPEVTSLPPEPPIDRNMLAVMWWSLKLRYWSMTENTDTGPSPDIRIFVVYYDPAENKQLAHSLGLEKGMLGVVNAFASHRMTQTNNVIIAHEILHTLGATDKYDLATTQPLYPDGYADPDRKPLHPQETAEIMGGRIPLSEEKAVIPRGLHQVVVGEKTAEEINWLN